MAYLDSPVKLVTQYKTHRNSKKVVACNVYIGNKSLPSRPNGNSCTKLKFKNVIHKIN